MRFRHVLRAAAALGALAIASACGTTVPLAERQQAQQQGVEAGPAGEEGLGGVPLDGSGAPVGTIAPDGTVSGGTSGGTSSGPRSSGGTAQPAAGGTTAGGGAVGPGVTDTEIFVGVAVTENSGAANSVIGAAGITTGDERAEIQALIDDANANGGVAGRKIVPVWHALDATSTKPTATLYQEMCDDWTQDHKVFVGFAGGDEVTLQCLHTRGVLALQDNLTLADESTFRRYPYYVEISSLNLDRIAAVEADALAAQNYFTGWNAATGAPAGAKAKVGVLTLDRASFAHATDQVLVPALARLGFAPAPENVVKVATPASTSDTGATAAAVSNAVLRFRSNGVTHVLILDASGVLTLLFLNTAESQRYRPRYGFNSQNGPQALADPGNIQTIQLVGSKGIGWIPAIDITPAQNPPNGPYSNDARRRCLAVMAKHGITFPNANAEAVAEAHCNTVFFFKHVFDVMGAGDVTRDRFMATVDRLGTGFQAAGTFVSRFGPGRHDGIGAVRHYAHDRGCDCMTYTSGNVDAP